MPVYLLFIHAQQVLTPVVSSLNLVSVWHTSQVISTMSLLEVVKCLSMEDVVGMITGLVPLKNVLEHVEEVSTINLVKKNQFLFCVGNNICGLDPETGLCEAYIPSYFYNETSKKCEKFIYGGCGGNANRFSTQDHCQETCG